MSETQDGTSASIWLICEWQGFSKVVSLIQTLMGIGNRYSTHSKCIYYLPTHFFLFSRCGSDRWSSTSAPHEGDLSATIIPLTFTSPSQGDLSPKPPLYPSPYPSQRSYIISGYATGLPRSKWVHIDGEWTAVYWYCGQQVRGLSVCVCVCVCVCESHVDD